MPEMRSVPAGCTVTGQRLNNFEYDHYASNLASGLIGYVDSNDINELSDVIHSANVDAGWWTDIATGLPKERNVGELLCLVHSEVSEALEGHRKGKQDDHLPHRPSIEVELADAIIRIFDLSGALNLDLGGAVAEKLRYNANRADHKIENRLKADGKKI